jgi:hypothetical protein
MPERDEICNRNRIQIRDIHDIHALPVRRWENGVIRIAFRVRMERRMSETQGDKGRKSRRHHS